MAYTLSLLDKSPVPPDAAGEDALATSVRFAQTAEACGYRRLWLAEHHGAPGLAGSAPEVLAAYLLAQTSHIRIGTGGILLQHYSPYKVAEIFKVLSALAPGRIDLGIGKAPGGLPASARALQSKHRATDLSSFDEQLRDLDDFLSDQIPAAHPFKDVVANPQVSTKPERFLLGGSPESAALAARLGWNFVYAGHFNSDPDNIERCAGVYGEAAGRSPLLALYAFAAESTARAREAVSHVRVFRLTLPDGRSVNVGSAQQAADFAQQAGASEYSLEERNTQVVAGAPEQVRSQLHEFAHRFGIEEFVIDTPVADPEARISSIQLIAGQSQTIAA
ncbi:LLM class flavin-dependent oxidoreductase [Terrarubrum flagellatum]|uniref:LLM class flavin-dependent oxidoreductase n=1 Tax=Terrirubrum flagellatum TaxID=2895980 RepID=UPI003144DBF1